MAANKDYVEKQATKAAQTNRPAPVLKPTTASIIKESNTAAYNKGKNK